jgi:hypothetical protein
MLDDHVPAALERDLHHPMLLLAGLTESSVGSGGFGTSRLFVSRMGQVRFAMAELGGEDLKSNL